MKVLSMYDTRIELVNVRVTKTHAQYTNIINAVRYAFIVRNEKGEEVKFTDVMKFNPSYGTGFTPIDQLTEADVITWIEKYLHASEKQKWIAQAQIEFDKPKQEDLID